MEVFDDALAQARAFTQLHATDMILAACGLALLACLLALAAILQRRTSKRARRQIARLQQRVDALDARDQGRAFRASPMAERDGALSQP